MNANITLDESTKIDQFREEMQHRVVRYPLNSRPVKEALRFAKKHQDPAFYRIASDKIHAQRQFQRELYGPSRMERFVDFFTLGSLKEVVVTLLLVAGGVVGLDLAKRAMQEPEEEIYAHMDVDALANRLGIALETSRLTRVEAASEAAVAEPGDGDVAIDSIIDAQIGQLSDEDVARIADAVTTRLRSLELRSAEAGKGGETKPSDADTTTLALSEQPADTPAE